MGKKEKKKKNYKKFNLFIAIIILIGFMFFYFGGDKLLNEINKSFNNLSGNVETVGKETLNKIKDIDYSVKKEDNLIKDKNNKIIYTNSNDLKIYFIDVGQGDSALIIKDDLSILIDAGDDEHGKKIVDFLKNKGISKLNYIVATNQNEDHIGGLDDVINNFEIDKIFVPDATTSTKRFTDLLELFKEKNLKALNPKKGEKFKLSDIDGEIMCSIKNGSNLNINSLVLKLTYKQKSFLFMGDAENINENSRKWTQTDVLKIGNHGSDTSSSVAFLKQVKPKYSIISVGENNDYKDPTETTIKRLQNIDSKIYRTDKDGTISLISDGNSVNIYTEK